MHCFFFFFNDTATTEIYTLSLHDALPISEYGSRPLPSPRLGDERPVARPRRAGRLPRARLQRGVRRQPPDHDEPRSEEHTSELQSRQYLVCRLLLEKKKKNSTDNACIPRT